MNFAEGDYANVASGARVVCRRGGGETVGFLLVITTFVASAGSYVFQPRESLPGTNLKLVLNTLRDTHRRFK